MFQLSNENKCNFCKEFRPKSEMSLKNLKMAFDGQLQRYQAFWDVLDDIDKNTWVLEPKQVKLVFYV